jgi:Arc/MetJ-type ribon-helix-helix transcriptional regulator
MNPMQRQITVRMPESLLDELDQRAALERRKRSDVIRLAIERFLEGPLSERTRWLRCSRSCTWLGRRMVREWFWIARTSAWRIHHTA